MHILAIHSNRPQETVSLPTQSTGTLMLNSTDTNQRHVLAFKKDGKRHDSHFEQNAFEFARGGTRAAF